MDPAARRWLHDKYERLAEMESQLAASRTSYFAAIGTVLLTGFVVSINYFLGDPTLLAEIVTFLAGLGVMISLVWVILLRRTVDAQQMWRHAAREVERRLPPIEGSVPYGVRTRTGATLDLDLLRPYTAHDRRFSDTPEVAWMDRLSPDVLTQILPTTFFAIWTSILVGIWVYVGVR